MTQYTLYFAYGSNLDAEQMEHRCPSAIQVATASLPGYRLAFSGWSHGRNGGVANVRRSNKRDKVRGVVWEVSLDDLKALDRCEGYPVQYDRRVVTVTDRHGRKLRCWCYYMKGRQDTRPSMDYFAMIAEAYQAYGFSQRRLTVAMLRAPFRSAPVRTLPRLRVVDRDPDVDSMEAWDRWLKSQKTA